MQETFVWRDLVEEEFKAYARSKFGKIRPDTWVIFSDEPRMIYTDPRPAIIASSVPALVEARGGVTELGADKMMYLAQDQWAIHKKRLMPLAAVLLALMLVVMCGWIALSPSEPDAVQVIRQVYAAGYANVQELPTKYIDMVPEAYRYTFTRPDRDMDAATWAAREKGLFYLTSEIQILGIQDPSLILLYERISIDDRYSEKMRSVMSTYTVGMLEACGLIEESIAAGMKTKSQHVF